MTTTNTILRDKIHYLQPMLSSDRRHALWYNGNVATVTNGKYTYALCANGNVDAYMDYHRSNAPPNRLKLYHDDTSESFAEYFKQLTTNIPNDISLLGLIDGKTINDISFKLADSNWWEIIVYLTNAPNNPLQSFCCESNMYDEAITEMIDVARRSPDWISKPDPSEIVYVYQETNDDAAFGDMLTVVFKNQTQARKYLRQRVEHFFEKSWEQCRPIVQEDDINSFSLDYVSYGPTSNGYCFWSIQPHTIH